jgi:hypothetical protein
LARAFASACVFPESSLENPVESTVGVELREHFVVITHPTQNAVGVGTHLRASSKARRRKRRCSVPSAGLVVKRRGNDGEQTLERLRILH